MFYFNRHPWFKKKKKKGGGEFNISSHPSGSKTPIQELEAPSEASLKSLLAPTQKGAESSNWLRKIYQICSFSQRRGLGPQGKRSWT
jgi:hypothetical protein